MPRNRRPQPGEKRYGGSGEFGQGLAALLGVGSPVAVKNELGEVQSFKPKGGRVVDALFNKGRGIREAGDLNNELLLSDRAFSQNSSLQKELEKIRGEYRLDEARIQGSNALETTKAQGANKLAEMKLQNELDMFKLIVSDKLTAESLKRANLDEIAKKYAESKIAIEEAAAKAFVTKFPGLDYAKRTPEMRVALVRAALSQLQAEIAESRSKESKGNFEAEESAIKLDVISGRPEIIADNMIAEMDKLSIGNELAKAQTEALRYELEHGKNIPFEGGFFNTKSQSGLMGSRKTMVRDPETGLMMEQTEPPRGFTLKDGRVAFPTSGSIDDFFSGAGDQTTPPAQPPGPPVREFGEENLAQTGMFGPEALPGKFIRNVPILSIPRAFGKLFEGIQEAGDYYGEKSVDVDKYFDPRLNPERGLLYKNSLRDKLKGIQP